MLGAEPAAVSAGRVGWNDSIADTGAIAFCDPAFAEQAARASLRRRVEYKADLADLAAPKATDTTRHRLWFVALRFAQNHSPNPRNQLNTHGA